MRRGWARDCLHTAALPSPAHSMLTPPRPSRRARPPCWLTWRAPRRPPTRCTLRSGSWSGATVAPASRAKPRLRWAGGWMRVWIAIPPCVCKQPLLAVRSCLPSPRLPSCPARPFICRPSHWTAAWCASQCRPALQASPLASECKGGAAWHGGCLGGSRRGECWEASLAAALRPSVLQAGGGRAL